MGWSVRSVKCGALVRFRSPDYAFATIQPLKELKVVSTGEDAPAQVSAINNFIDAGYDAIIVNAQNPTAFGPVIKRAKEAGVILVTFDNILDTEDASNVDVDQKGLGVKTAITALEGQIVP